MELVTFAEPARVWKQGEQVLANIGYPSRLKLQVTGTDEQTLLHQGPEQAKRWIVTLRVEIREIDA